MTRSDAARPSPAGHGDARDAREVTAPARDPRVGEVAVSLVRRAVLPGVVAAILLWAVGWMIMNPWDKIPAEEGINAWFASLRTPTGDAITHVWSTSTDTFFAIGFGIVSSLLVWALTRRWWLGILPIGAITLESSIFVPVTNILGRPRPLVEHLDAAPPTSSYPSGHTAAAFALYVTLFLLARRIPQRWLRTLVQALCLLWPCLVAIARLYRGMHHVSDVLMGMVLGVWCAFVIVRAVPGAWEFTRRTLPVTRAPT
ncbi:MAG: phosphatase PAP2 family protein [Dermatophilaceae bacterium]